MKQRKQFFLLGESQIKTVMDGLNLITPVENKFYTEKRWQVVTSN